MVQVEVARLDTDAGDKACTLTFVETKGLGIGVREKVARESGRGKKLRLCYGWCIFTLYGLFQTLGKSILVKA